MNRRRLLDWLLARIGMQIIPSVDHLALYRAKVTGQSGQTVSVTCDDTRIGSLSSVPLFVTEPGCDVSVEAGAFVLIGWIGGDPRSPYACGWERGATVNEIWHSSPISYFGIAEGGSGVDSVVTRQDLKFLYHSISGAAIVANDGGAAFKTSLSLALAAGGWGSAASDGAFGAGSVAVKR